MNYEAVCRTAPATPGLLNTALEDIFILVHPVLEAISMAPSPRLLSISPCPHGALWCEEEAEELPESVILDVKVNLELWSTLINCIRRWRV